MPSRDILNEITTINNNDNTDFNFNKLIKIKFAELIECILILISYIIFTSFCLYKLNINITSFTSIIIFTTLNLIIVSIPIIILSLTMSIKFIAIIIQTICDENSFN